MSQTDTVIVGLVLILVVFPACVALGWLIFDLSSHNSPPRGK